MLQATAPDAQPEASNHSDAGSIMSWEPQDKSSLFIEDAQHESHKASSANDFYKPDARPGTLKTAGYSGLVSYGDTTPFGRIIGSRGLSRGSRHILNVGTLNQPVYKCLPGATSGRGTGAD